MNNANFGYDCRNNADNCYFSPNYDELEELRKKISKYFFIKAIFCGKMLMFAKVSLESFVYDLTEIFFFPNEWTKEIYNYYMIDRIFPYSIITDADSICIFFIFIRKLESCAPDLVFKMMFCTDSIPHINFGRNVEAEINIWKKTLGYFCIETIDNPWGVAVALNPNEYFEEFERQSVNKKHEGLRKGASGIELEDYAKRINLIREIETFGQLPKEKVKQNRFTIKNNQDDSWRNWKI